MARDGTWIEDEPLRGRFASQVALEAALAPGFVLCVRCPGRSCGALAAFDAGAWLVRGLGRVRLGSLHSKLRCLSCGGRQGVFEIWSARALPPGLPRWSAAQLVD